MVVERFFIEGGNRLCGEVEVSGAKNAALKLIAAALLAPGRTVLHNVPRIKDVETMLAVLEGLGAPSKFSGNTLSIYASGVSSYTAPYDLVRQMRASIVVLGPLVARFGGAEVNFEYPSVTATENVMMAAVLARGTTIIQNGAREPEVVALADFLNLMGARIFGAGTGRIVVEGVDELRPIEYAVMGDRVEVGTFIMATAAAGGDVLVKGADPGHLKMELPKLREMGVEVQDVEDGLRVRVDEPSSLGSVDVATLPFPGLATDLQAQMMVLLTQTSGAGIITENVYENRLQVAEELNRLNAGIDLFGGHRALIRGPRRLSG